MKKYNLILKEEGQMEILKTGNLKEIVAYLKENEALTDWIYKEEEQQPDDLQKTESLKLEGIETVRELRAELKKIDLGWWTLEIIEVEEIGD